MMFVTKGHQLSPGHLKMSRVAFVMGRGVKFFIFLLGGIANGSRVEVGVLKFFG